MNPKSRLARPLTGMMILALLLSLNPIVAIPAHAASPDIVISQVYGGGGNTGATYKNDFAELFNRGTAPVSLAGWSIQYASATGSGNFGASSTQITELPAVTLEPGQYFLIQEAQGTGGTTDLPTPDVVDSTPIAMSATGGKVALVNIATSLGCNGGSTPCSTAQLAQIVDLVGWDGANFFEGTVAPATSNTTAILRANGGCVDTDNNSADFSTGAPNPRNTVSPLSPCVGDAAPTVTSTTPADGATGVLVGSSITVNLSESVDVAAGAITVECPAGNVVASNALADNVTSVIIDPASDLPTLASCVINVDPSGVTDEDTNDPPDTLAGQTSFGFTTEGPVCEQPFTPIYSIQGSGLSAAITGTVTTQGIVVGDFETNAGIQGFYIQDAAGDGLAETSDGIFVFTGNANTVSAGQLVRVTGYARERFNQTTLNGSNSNTSAVPAANIANCGSGSVTPTDVTMPFASLDYPERFEGMLVRLPQALVISEYFNYERYGEMVLALPLDGESRAFTGTAIDEPGAPALDRALKNSLRRITLDDGLGTQNPSLVRHPNGSNFALNNRFRGGNTVQNTVGVLGYDFSLYRIQPTGPADYVAVNPRTTAPEPVGGSLRVAAMNTLNFFLTPDYPTGDPLDNKCGPLQSVECRGTDADQPLEFTRQRDKLLAALAGLDADIIGLNELENTAGVEPLGDPTNGIVAGLNATLGAGTYAYIDTGVIGTDAIRVGMIYKPGKVTPVGDFKLLTTAVDSRFLDTKNRPSLAQTFEVLATGARFTVAVNHLKSKGSDCNDVGDPDMLDGQGNCNLTRKAAAQALVDWLATDPTGSGDPDFLIMGDLNSYAKEDPIDAVLAGPDDTAGTSDDYTNLIAHYQGKYAYSYVFDGQSGYLDQALANPSLAAQVTGAADWHINADEPDLLDYDTSFKPPAQEAIYEPNAYRSSDHDPVVVGLNLNAPPSVNAGGPYSVVEGGSVLVTASGSDPNAGDVLTYAWDLDGNGAFETPGQSVTFSAAALDGPGTRTIVVQVTDNGGLTATAQAIVNILNVAPTATFYAASPINEGSPFNVSLTHPFDPSNADTAAGFTYTFDCGQGYGAPNSNSTTCTAIDNPSQTVKGKIADKDGGLTEYVATVTVSNVKPSVGPISAPADPVLVNTLVNATASFTDPGVLDTHTAVWDWGDGTTSAGAVSELNGSGSMSGTHTYTAAGLYTVKLTVTDKDGASAQSVFRYIVVYDPEAGFVTGGGWIDSPAGAYPANPTLTGKAIFGLLAWYPRGAHVPRGQTQFYLHVAHLNLHSTSYQWLVIAGSKAQYRGSGKINGAGEYGFLVTVTDSKVRRHGDDTLRIKIWDKATGNIIYDNQMGAPDDADATQVVKGGSIVIHK